MHARTAQVPVLRLPLLFLVHSTILKPERVLWDAQRTVVVEVAVEVAVGAGQRAAELWRDYEDG